MNERLSVSVAVTRPDGSVEHVRVGTAVKSNDGFLLTFDQMSMRHDAFVPSQTSAPRRAPSSGGAGDTGAVFPPYGRSKGMPVFGATMQDLEFYASGSRRTLSDPSKARWHDKETAFLAVLEAEIARQRGGGDGGASMMPDDGIPPPGDEDAPF